ncbi:MAG: LLM class flavin-dependent oxidoreductase [candidate division NC10 bacterium]|nr:LLM class flavin-dependent oxidoreductase [candidate division NC10 bacterium]
MSTKRIRFGLWYDFRNPPQWRRPSDRLYGEVLEQIAWAEGLGFEYVWLSEHHFLEDGYSPGLLPIAAAVAARTRTIRIGTAVLLLPFHHPVRVAEDGAIVDVISGGRFELGVGVGYRAEEFQGFAVPIEQRAGRTEEGLEIVRRLWEGETVKFRGRYYEVPGVKLAPAPIQKPRPPLWVGGFTPKAAARAASYADGYIGMGPMTPLCDAYLRALGAAGKDRANARIAGGFMWLLASRDPERTWSEAADHVLYQINLYAEWSARTRAPLGLPPVAGREELRRTGLLKVATPEECRRLIADYLGEVPITHFYTWTLPPGLPPAWVAPHLELFAREVIPHFGELDAGPPDRPADGRDR